MPDLPCPRCQTPIQPDWDWCRSCGYDPLGKRPPGDVADGPDGPDGATGDEGPAATAPPRRNVYDPDARTTSPVTIGLIGLAGVVVVALIGLALLRQAEDDTGPATANAFIPGGEIDFQRGIAELDDGWSRIEVDEGTVAVDLPGPLLRSRDELLVADVGEVPMAVWGGGRAGEVVYGLAVGELPERWRDRPDELLASVPLPVDLDVVERSRRSTEVDGHPAAEIRATGGDGDLWALVVVNDDRLVTVLYGADDGDVDDVSDRVRSSMVLG